jgi:hypothetical protein
LDPDDYHPAIIHDDPHIRGEQAVIIWDSAHHVEHFIRQASIDTKSATLAFLVPTPTPPQLDDADSHIFDMADSVAHGEMKPQYINRDPLELVAACLMPMSMNWDDLGIASDQHPVVAPVPVISQEYLGGYQATVLDASNGPAMQAWLLDHDFRMTDAAAAWLRPYVAAKWSITAFQLTRRSSQPSDGLTTATIRMSFRTDRPFYPYSEPVRNLPAGRTYEPRVLSVALLSDEKMQGSLAEGLAWPAKLQFAGPSDPVAASVQPSDQLSQNDAWAKLANLQAGQGAPKYLTYFRDLSNPRPGKTDLFFSPARDQRAYRQEWTDYSHAVERFNFANFGADFFALVVLGLMIAAPLYCGVRVYRRAEVDWVGEGTKRDRLMAGSAMALGIWEMFIFGILAVSSVSGLAESVNNGDLGSAMGVLIFEALLGGVAWSIFYCGLSLWRDVSMAPVPIRSRFYGLGSCLGGLAILVVLMVILSRVGVMG